MTPPPSPIADQPAPAMVRRSVRLALAVSLLLATFGGFGLAFGSDRLDPVIAAGGPLIVLADRGPRDGRARGRRGAQPFPGRVGQSARRLLRGGAPRRGGTRARTARAGAGRPASRPRGWLRRDERLHRDAPHRRVQRADGPAALDRVLLELSEHDQVEDYAALSATLAPFRAAGLRLAIDDVGAGFSSLRHIVITSPSVIKIDRSIIAGLDTDPVVTKLVQSLVDFGHGCDVRVVAESIETAGEAAALRALGVDFGQGWHYGRPGPPEALSEIAPVVIPAPRRRHAAALTA